MLLWTWSPSPDEMSLMVLPQTESNERGKRSGRPASSGPVCREGRCLMSWDAQSVGMGVWTNRSLWPCGFPRKYIPSKLFTQESCREQVHDSFSSLVCALQVRRVRASPGSPRYEWSESVVPPLQWSARDRRDH